MIVVYVVQRKKLRAASLNTMKSYSSGGQYVTKIAQMTVRNRASLPQTNLEEGVGLEGPYTPEVGSLF